MTIQITEHLVLWRCRACHSQLVSPSDHPLTKCSKRFSESRGEFQAIVSDS